jgi:hypothetical protein
LVYGGDIGTDGVLDALCVVPFLEFGNEILPLKVADEAVGQFILEVAADLSKVFTVVDSDEQKCPGIVGAL